MNVESEFVGHDMCSKRRKCPENKDTIDPFVCGINTGKRGSRTKMH